MSRGRSLSQVHSPAPRVSFMWMEQTSAYYIRGTDGGCRDESPFTVKLSDARHTHASRERKASCSLAVQPGVAKKRHKIIPVISAFGGAWVRVHSLQLPTPHLSPWSVILIAVKI